MRHLLDIKKPMARHMKKEIWSIIKILALLGVAGILAAMFLPESTPPGKAAHRIWCMSNMRQIYLALTMYAGDNPTYPSGNREYYPEESGDKGLRKLLAGGYLENKKTYRCPKDKREKKTFWEKIFGGSPDPEELKFKSDYIYLGGFAVDESSIVPILFDKIGNHNNYCNVIFSDGHSEYYELQYSSYGNLMEAINKKKNYPKETMARIKESLRKALKNNKADNEGVSASLDATAAESM